MDHAAMFSGFLECFEYLLHKPTSSVGLVLLAPEPLGGEMSEVYGVSVHAGVGLVPIWEVFCRMEGTML